MAYDPDAPVFWVGDYLIRAERNGKVAWWSGLPPHGISADLDMALTMSRSYGQNQVVILRKGSRMHGWSFNLVRIPRDPVVTPTAEM